MAALLAQECEYGNGTISEVCVWQLDLLRCVVLATVLPHDNSAYSDVRIWQLYFF